MRDELLYMRWKLYQQYEKPLDTDVTVAELCQVSGGMDYGSVINSLHIFSGIIFIGPSQAKASLLRAASMVSQELNRDFCECW